jgi:hypothetical protein
MMMYCQVVFGQENFHSLRVPGCSEKLLRAWDLFQFKNLIRFALFPWLLPRNYDVHAMSILHPVRVDK